MHFLPLTLLLTFTLFASPQDINSFHSSFDQRSSMNIKKNCLHGRTMGHPNLKMHCGDIKNQFKKVFISAAHICYSRTVIEQATIRTLNDEIDFLEIIKKAKKIDNDHYKATVNGQLYTITFKNDLLSTIQYTDGYDNKVTIQFLKPSHNTAIPSSRFQPSIPAIMMS